jgi:UDP-N-acetylglucosamine acyltransferase
MAAKPHIDERAVVHTDAEIGDGTYIGPFCVIGAEVKIGKNCRLESHVSVPGPVEMGDDNVTAGIRRT